MATDVIVKKHYICCKSQPRAAPPAISHALLSLKRIPAMAATPAIAIPLQSVTTCPARLMTTDAINPTALIFTASRKADITFDALSLGMSGFSNRTKRKEGRKMAIVETNAPSGPEIT